MRTEECFFHQILVVTENSGLEIDTFRQEKSTFFKQCNLTSIKKYGSKNVIDKNNFALN